MKGVHNLLSDAGLLFALSFLFLLGSFGLGAGIAFSGHEVMRSISVILPAIILVAGNVIIFVSSIRNLLLLEKKLASSFSALFSIISAVVLLVPIFDQLGWFGF